MSLIETTSDAASEITANPSPLSTPSFDEDRYFVLADGLNRYHHDCGQGLHGSRDLADILVLDSLESALFLADDYIRQLSDEDISRETVADIKSRLEELQNIGAPADPLEVLQTTLALAEMTQRALKIGHEPSLKLVEAWIFTPKMVAERKPLPRPNVPAVQRKRAFKPNA